MKPGGCKPDFETFETYPSSTRDEILILNRQFVSSQCDVIEYLQEGIRVLYEWRVGSPQTNG